MKDKEQESKRKDKKEKNETSSRRSDLKAKNKARKSRISSDEEGEVTEKGERKTGESKSDESKSSEKSESKVFLCYIICDSRHNGIICNNQRNTSVDTYLNRK